MLNSFRAYGFLKNLKFFEPYLLIFFLEKDISFTLIGTLFSIRFLTTWVFEIPSGIIADSYSKKRALIISLSAYIISFVLFYFSKSYLLLCSAMLLFGIGEAFRSGTHKGIIMDHLHEIEEIDNTHIYYSSTRTFSMLGSAFNALISIVIILIRPKLKMLFLAAIVPYILCLLLILTYPEYKKDKKVNIKYQLKKFVEELKKFINSRGILDYAASDAFYKSVKVYLQPVIVLSIPVLAVFLSEKGMKNINIGIVYFFLNLINAYSSQMSKRLKDVSKKDIHLTLNRLGYMMFFSITLSAITLYYKLTIVPVLFFIIMYVFYNLRKPVFVSYFSLYTSSDQRASMLSAASFISVLFSAMLSPLIGFLADLYSVSLSLIILSVFYIILYFFISVRRV